MQDWDRVIYTLSVKIPYPTIPTNRKKEENWKTVEDKKGGNSYSNKKTMVLMLKHASPTPLNRGSAARSHHGDKKRQIKVL